MAAKYASSRSPFGDETMSARLKSASPASPAAEYGRRPIERTTGLLPMLRQTRLLVAGLAVLVAGLLAAWQWGLLSPGDPVATPPPTGASTGRPGAVDARIAEPASQDPAKKTQGPPQESVPVRSISGAYPGAFEIAQESSIPDGPVLETFKSLEAAAAAGNSHAGYVAFEVVYRCHDTGLADAASAVKEAPNIPAARDSVVKRKEQLLRDCEGVTWKEIQRGFDLLRAAAEKGDLEAQLRYPAIGYDELPNKTEMIRSPEKITRFKEDSMRFLHAAANRGNESAMSTLSSFYYDGIMTTRDPVRAYVYAYARSLLMQPLSAPGERVLAFYAQGLSQQQLQSAQMQAAVLLERCCR